MSVFIPLSFISSLRYIRGSGYVVFYPRSRCCAFVATEKTVEVTMGNRTKYVTAVNVMEIVERLLSMIVESGDAPPSVAFAVLGAVEKTIEWLLNDEWGHLFAVVNGGVTRYLMALESVVNIIAMVAALARGVSPTLSIKNPEKAARMAARPAPSLGNSKWTSVIMKAAEVREMIEKLRKSEEVAEKILNYDCGR